MLQRNASSLRSSALVLTSAIVLFGVVPYHVIAQPAVTPVPVPTTPSVPPMPPSPPSTATAVVPAIPPAPPAPPHPASNGKPTQGNSDHVHVLTDDNILNAVGGIEHPRALKSQRREQQMSERDRQELGRQQWARSERLRVANEAARREADRMINAASPMDRPNRYSSD